MANLGIGIDARHASRPANEHVCEVHVFFMSASVRLQRCPQSKRCQSSWLRSRQEESRQRPLDPAEFRGVLPAFYPPPEGADHQNKTAFALTMPAVAL